VASSWKAVVEKFGVGSAALGVAALGVLVLAVVGTNARKDRDEAVNGTTAGSVSVQTENPPTTVYDAAEAAVQTWRDLPRPAEANGLDESFGWNYFDIGREAFAAACARNEIWAQVASIGDPLSDPIRSAATASGDFRFLKLWDRGSDLYYRFAVAEDGRSCAGHLMNGNAQQSKTIADTIAAGGAVLAFAALTYPTTDGDRSHALLKLSVWEAASGSNASAERSNPAGPESSSRMPTEAEVRTTAIGKTKEQLRSLYGNPDVAGEYSASRTYWTYWSPRLAVIDEDTRSPNSQGTTFVFDGLGSVYEVKF
jgi:hypothetical protein